MSFTGSRACGFQLKTLIFNDHLMVKLPRLMAKLECLTVHCKFFSYEFLNEDRSFSFNRSDFPCYATLLSATNFKWFQNNLFLIVKLQNHGAIQNMWYSHKVVGFLARIVIIVHPIQYKLQLTSQALITVDGLPMEDF